MLSIRVLHCPNMVGGNPQELARAERELGLKSWSVSLTQNRYGFKADEVLRGKGKCAFLSEAKRWELLWRAVRDFDIIHFNFGQSIMPQWIPLSTSARGTHVTPAWYVVRRIYQCYARLFELRDLPLLKKAGKGIVVTYQGDDARQGDFCQANFEINAASEVETGYYSPRSDAHKRYRIARFAQYADRIYALNPDLLNVLPERAQFLPYSTVVLNEWKPIRVEKSESKPLTVLHAPSHRGVKGTRYVLEAMRLLKERDKLNFEFILLEGVPRDEAKQIYARADLLVDQLLCGWYGGLAVELMALGKPVVSYVRENDLRFIPRQMKEELPIINATPTTLYDTLKEWLIERRHELPLIGERSRAYVEKWHDPLKIAARLKTEYQAIVASKQLKGQR